MTAKANLRCYMNLMAFHSLPASAGTFEANLQKLRSHNFQGVQFADWANPEDLAICRSLQMGIAASGRVNTPAETRALAERASGDGYEGMTVHAGWGLEDDPEACAMIESVLAAADRWRVPIYIETHRATICQDMWRTVQFVKRFPEMRFNGDFSHWYAGQEMVYGGFEKKLAFIQPVLDRVRFIHGRVANPGCIQAPLADRDGEAPYVDHFRRLWTASFRGFLASREGEAICFTPELLGPDIYYARTFGGVEETDRWQETLTLNHIARQCFACAERGEA